MAVADLIGTGTVPARDREPVTVYTLPLCARSIATMRDLSLHGIGFTEVDLSADANARARVEALGYMRAPVVVAGNLHWAGYNPEAIERLAPQKPRLRVAAGARHPGASLSRRSA